MDNGNSSKFEDLGELGGLGRTCGVFGDLGDMGDTGGLRGTGGSGRDFAWQILVRPTQFCPGRAGCGPSQNLPDPMPEAWILALVRPTQKNVGRESSGNAGVEQMLAGEGTFSTLAMLPGSSRIWPRPDLARPWVLAKSGPGPILMGALQNGFWPSLALYGSVYNSEGWVLHGLNFLCASFVCSCPGLDV